MVSCSFSFKDVKNVFVVYFTGLEFRHRHGTAQYTKIKLTELKPVLSF